MNKTTVRNEARRKKSRKLKRGIATIMVAMSMVFAIPTVSNATTVTTSKYSSSGTYYYYVRQSGSSTELGVMKLSHDSTTVYNTFTASKSLGAVKVYVTYNSDSGYKSNSVSSLSTNASVIASKSISGTYSKTYGYCSVTY